MIILSSGNFYLYKGVTLEMHSWMGPCPLRRTTFEPRSYANVSSRIWSLCSKFAQLSDLEQKQYLIMGS